MGLFQSCLSFADEVIKDSEIPVSNGGMRFEGNKSGEALAEVWDVFLIGTVFLPSGECQRKYSVECRHTILVYAKSTFEVFGRILKLTERQKCIAYVGEQ